LRLAGVKNNHSINAIANGSVNTICLVKSPSKAKRKLRI